MKQLSLFSKLPISSPGNPVPILSSSEKMSLGTGNNKEKMIPRSVMNKVVRHYKSILLDHAMKLEKMRNEIHDLKNKK